MHPALSVPGTVPVHFINDEEHVVGGRWIDRKEVRY
jgi:hypothetical protein